MTEQRQQQRISLHIDDIEAQEVAPGITVRRFLPTAAARGWLIDFAPGSEWPTLDVHEDEERYYVISGEVIEGERTFGEGSYVVFAPGSSHRPRSDRGARMLGINIAGPPSGSRPGERLRQDG
ncbi:cupin domain-containing protein [Streptomyces sp. NBC_00344]|uniref:cupin domain-containing protein n=1 Tax=Streptomyces sp. NBC_00344 TaxID=2975720 RepID=UPI002E248520